MGRLKLSTSRYLHQRVEETITVIFGNRPFTAMDRKAISSSELASIGYDPISLVLEVEFNNGRIYEYHGVPAIVNSGLMTAASHGRYFNQYVRNAGYVCVRLV